MSIMKFSKVAFLGLCAALCIVCLQTGNVEGAAYSIAVDAQQQAGQWNRFYEQVISTDHMNTMLSSAYGRNMQNALRRGAIECGFKYFRGHGILNSDIGLYSEPNGVPAYNWSKFDSVYDAAKALGIRPMIEFSFTPTAMASGTSTCLWYNGAAGNTTLPKDFTKWRDLCDSIVLHCENRYSKEEVEKWFFEVYNEPNLGNFFFGLAAGLFQTVRLGLRRR
jgi:xylan 1,4-beta-xylosidase